MVMGMVSKAPADSPPGMGMMALVFLLVFAFGWLVLQGLAILVGALVGKARGFDDSHYGSWSRFVGLRMLSYRSDHRFWMVGAGLGAFVLQGVLFVTLPMAFQPPLNLDFSTVRIGMPPGVTLKQTEEVADRASAIIQADPSVDRVFQRVYVGSGFLNIVLKKDRKVTSTDFERTLGPKLAAIPDARVNFQSQNGGGPGGGGRDYVLYLGGNDPDLLLATANKIADEMATIPELRAPRAMGDLVRPEITIKPRFDLAADLGVTTTALSQTIRIATLGDIAQNSAKFSLADRQVPITVSISENARRDLSVLENLPVPTTRGGSVPLKAIADIGFGSGPTTVQRTNQIRRIAVGADYAPNVVASQASAKIDKLPTVAKLPDGIQKLQLGDSKWQAELVYYFFIALGSGVLLVFAVLVLLYRRFLSPLVNMGSLLLAPLGAAVGLHLAGQPVSLPVFIGILMLFGIVAKNSILLVDFAVEMMDHGMDRSLAIIEAGHKRAQPIVMTTVAMGAGMLPIALKIGADADFRAPMAIAVIGGLLTSTVLSLFYVPVVFTLVDDVKTRLARLFSRKPATTLATVAE
jgi:multidrug efflux pump subunit AcrB